jgi:hypothetical protein
VWICMMDDDNRTPAPKQNLNILAKSHVELWQAMAENACHIAAARRTIFLAYLAEGFNEAQALELIKLP